MAKTKMSKSYKRTIDKIIHSKLTPRRKRELEKAIKKVIREYGECLRKLGDS